MERRMLTLASGATLAVTLLSTWGVGCSAGSAAVDPVVEDGGGVRDTVPDLPTVAEKGDSGSMTGRKTGGGDAGPGSGIDAGDVDGGAGDDAGDSDGGPSGGTCPATVPIDSTKFAYRPANVSPGACSLAEVGALTAFLDANPDASYSSAKGSVANPTCQACIFGPDGATWGPIVENSAGTFMVLNTGGCAEVVSGSVDCGRAKQRVDRCVEEACAFCGDDAGARTECMTKTALTGACKPAVDALHALPSCSDAAAQCDQFVMKYMFEASAKTLCVDPLYGRDGGTF